MGNSTEVESLASLQKELDKLLAKRDQMNMKMMDRYHNGSATRARTTTSNANIGHVNDQIIEIRNSIGELQT